MTGSARRHAYQAAPLIAAAVLAMAALGAHHLRELRPGHLTDFQLVVLASYVYLLVISTMPLFHRDIWPAPASRWVLSHEYVLTIVPAHNEDPAMFTAMLESVAAQTRPPDRLHIVENGDPDRGYVPRLGEVVQRWAAGGGNMGMDVRYDFNPVPDKRKAQMLAVLACPQATIHMTLDSDVELGHPDTIERGLDPFCRRNVMSVCGLLVGKNWNHSLLTRLVDLGFVGSFVNGRAAFSMLGNVTVNTGGLAFYRAWIIRKYRSHYLGHKIFNRQMSYGDDAMWTRYAMLEGRTKFQRSAWAYTLHPERRSHLAKQRTRWHRSWVWGNLWLLRNFSPRRTVWWLVAWQFVSFVWFTFTIPAVLVLAPIRTGDFAWAFFAWFAVVSYLGSMSYLTVKRPDQTFWQTYTVWLLSPLCAGLNFYIGWCLRYVGLFTCLRTGWSTRGKVEVGLTSGACSVPTGR